MDKSIKASYTTQIQFQKVRKELKRQRRIEKIKNIIENIKDKLGI